MSEQRADLYRPNDSIFSVDTVLKNFQDFPEILGPVVSLFLDAYPADMQALRLAVERGNERDVAFVAHKIRGSVGCFHADRAAAIAAEVEGRGDSGELQGLLNVIEHLETAMVSVSSVL